MAGMAAVGVRFGVLADDVEQVERFIEAEREADWPLREDLRLRVQSFYVHRAGAMGSAT